MKTLTISITLGFMAAVPFFSFSENPSAYDLIAQKAVWGAETNALRAGLLYITNYQESYGRLDILVENTDIQNSRYAYPNLLFRPKPQKLFDIELQNNEGKSVLKTRYGQSFGMPISDRVRVLGLRHPRIRFIKDGYPDILHSMNLDEFFEIEKDGEYILEVEVRLLKMSKDRKHLESFRLPKVKLSLVLNRKR